MSKNTAVFGIYSSQAGVQEAVDQLRAAGFRNTDVSVLFSDNVGTKDFAHERSSKAPEGAITGAGLGGLLGATAGWLCGIGVLAVPGLGPFLAAGPIMALLSGLGVGGVIGGLAGGLVGLSI